MKLREIVKALDLQNLTPQLDALGGDVTAGFASDLLSDVLAHAPAGSVLVTVQAHLNVVAVGVHAELSAVILAAGRQAEPAVCAKAAQEGLPLLASPRQAFDIAGQLYAMGLRGQP